MLDLLNVLAQHYTTLLKHGQGSMHILRNNFQFCALLISALVYNQLGQSHIKLQ